MTLQSAGSVQLSEGMQRLTEAAAAATAQSDSLGKRVAELEEKLRSKDKRIQTLKEQKAEAEAQLQVRLPNSVLLRMQFVLFEAVS